MADTIQLVQWALGQTCSLRPPRDDGFPETPTRVLDQVRTLQTYASGLSERDYGFGVYGDICVTSTTYGARPGGKKWKLGPTVPAGGFVISREFAPLGGIEALKDQCARCPANVAPPTAAQCAGTLQQWPDSRETEEQLQRIISRLGLAREMAERFPATTPVWYGLWAVSPVPVASLPLLRLLLGEMLGEDRRDTKLQSRAHQSQFRDFEKLIAAIDIAEAKKLPLHVKLTPLGHTDFGIYTIFPHCPFCKACARTERWRNRYPSELLECHVCGTRFSPSETASSSKMKWESDELREEMGDEAFHRFTADYLLARGEAPEKIPGIIAATAEKEREREEKNRMRLEEERRNREYVETHIFRDLPRVSPPSPEHFDGDDDDDDESSEEADDRPWFAIEEVEEIIRRCEVLGVQILAMIHRSRDEDMDQFESINARGASATEILTQWKAEGCNEKFWVSCSVPKELQQ